MNSSDSTFKIFRYIVPASCSGLRVDVFLKTRLKKMSRTRIQQMIERGVCYFENKKNMNPSARVDVNDVICIKHEVKEDEPEFFVKPGIIYRDENIIVVNKPPFLPVHPTTRYPTFNLRNILKKEFDVKEVRLCHRIDRETSGIVVIATNIESERCIKRQFRERAVRKTYRALVWGVLEENEGVINASLRWDSTSRIKTKMEVVPEQSILRAGKNAITRFKVIERSRRFSLVECYPETGRQHQIRIHLKHIGHPVVGDKLYSINERVAEEYFRVGFTDNVAKQLILPRQALHAYSISFEHPATGREVEYIAPLADDIAEVLRKDIEE